MGRPVNKRYFGHGNSSHEIKVRFKLAGTEYDGWIVKQRSTHKFKVSDGTHTGICRLVNKNIGSLSNNEMCINLLTDTGTMVQATKLFNRTFIVEGGTVNSQNVKWNFASCTSDGADQVADADDSALSLTITIGTHPQSVTKTAPATATFTVVASGVGDLQYQWQIQQEGAGAWANITGATSASYTTGATATGDGAGATDGDKYRVIVSSASAAASPVTSNVATLTVV